MRSASLICVVVVPTALVTFLVPGCGPSPTTEKRGLTCGISRMIVLPIVFTIMLAVLMGWWRWRGRHLYKKWLETFSLEGKGGS